VVFYPLTWSGFAVKFQIIVIISLALIPTLVTIIIF